MVLCLSVLFVAGITSQSHRPDQGNSRAESTRRKGKIKEVAIPPY
jgi:hypothetical protein